ncbi:hypothetical protein D9756_003103 [Leucocoprinus leucothites]|uniref:Nephrocystin 3-like N-terminal domain-containing protein n=1 Tax=Leucocoprinus leucothites TaxID=201217 RepID=A0A8H5G776_9AGAR|nr:hypothetical protein D9756_003103 [Leucoagaricus leucothites]
MSTTGFFQGSSNFVIENLAHVEVHNPVPNVQDEKLPEGIQILLKESNPDAFHNSYARDPPPRCHPGTRRELVCGIEQWAAGASERSEHIMWVYGPAGVGKSAVAQSCAELFADGEKLGAAYFFSRPNHRDKARHLVPSIAFQLSTKCREYRDILDRRIRNDPTLPSRAIHEQLQELVVKPLEEAWAHGVRTMYARYFVVIIDGLDECESSDAQRRILDAVTKSVQGQTLPFRWIVFSRAEPQIVALFKRDFHSLTFRKEVPVSRDIDHEILCFLNDKFKEIGRAASLPSSWFSEDDIQTLVNLCAGLFIYAATIERFVHMENSLGPVSQLRTVLRLASNARERGYTAHPLHELDLFYTLIMEQVPLELLPVMQRILLLRSLNLPFVLDGTRIANVLGLDQPQFQHICSFLHSVLELENPDGDSTSIKFHHASFMDFMQDVKRSTRFSIHRDDVIDFARSELLDSLNGAMASGIGIRDPIETNFSSLDSTKEEPQLFILSYRIKVLFNLCENFYPVKDSTASKLVTIQFGLLPGILRHSYPHFGNQDLDPERLRKQLPRKFRGKIARPGDALWKFRIFSYLHKPLSHCRCTAGAYVLGHGRNKVACCKIPQVYSHNLEIFTWRICPYPSSIFAKSLAIHQRPFDDSTALSTQLRLASGAMRKAQAITRIVASHK